MTAHRNDVYITASGLGQSQKLSLHESGIWRHAFLSEQHAAASSALGQAQYNNDPRVLDRWEEPEGTQGWMHALTVWVPFGHLTPLPDEVDNPRKPIRFLPAPQSAQEVGLHFAVVRPDEGWINFPDMDVIDGFGLPNKRAFIVLTSRQAVEPARAQWVRDMSVAALVMAQGNNITAYGDPLRVGLFTQGDNGSRAVLDLRAPSRELLEHVNQTGLTVNRTYKPPSAPE